MAGLPPHRTTRAYAEPDSASARLFRQAQDVLPGGNSRTTVFIEPYPPYAASGEGCWIVDVDGERRLDALGNYTALIHGHAHPVVTRAATERMQRGASFAMPTPEEIELARLLTDRVPSIERIRFTNSGTEAVMMAIKAARGFTGRPKIAKCEGAYHGSYDHAEVSLSSTPDNWGALGEPARVAYSAGTPPAVLADTVVLPFNHPELAARLIERDATSLAAVVLDAIPNRIGLIPATRHFLETIRTVTAAHGILLILDEVITFRAGYHGAQGRLGIRPDLTTLGKIIGGGFPVGAVGGRADVMAVFDPRGGRPAVPHGGTFNANPVTMAAGLAAMRLLDETAFQRLEDYGDKLRASMNDCFKRSGVSGRVTGIGSLFRIHPIERDAIDYRSARPDGPGAARLARIARYLLDHGVFISTTGLGCLSTVMADAEIEWFMEVFAAALTSEA